MNHTETLGIAFRGRAARLLMLCAMVGASTASAQSLTDVSYALGPSGSVEVLLAFDGTPPTPRAFTTEDPPRLAFDFPGVTNSAAARTLTINQGATRGAALVEAGGRTRLVIDLNRPATYTTRTERNNFIVAIGSGGGSTLQGSAGQQLGEEKRAVREGLAVTGFDFRRGPNGEGRVLLDFSAEGAGADLRTEGSKILLDLINTDVPEDLRKKYDVSDFATPVGMVEIEARGNGARVTIQANGIFQQLAYQVGTQYVVEVAPVVEDAAQSEEIDGKKTYVGTRVTFNFQDIPVRAALQLIADVAELNIVVSDTVSGNATLRLINVPWDQALDILLESRKLDKRQNGNVIWVALAEEIIEREKQQAEGRKAQEAAAPTQTVFVKINYGKAEDIAKLLTEDALEGESQGGGDQQGSGSDRGFLSSRGSISFDVRTNTLLITDVADRVDRIMQVIAQLDRPVQQVLIESRIVVANESFGKELGSRFGFSAAAEDSDNNLLMTSGRLEALDEMNNTAVFNRLLGLPSSLPVAVPTTPPGGPLDTPELFDRLNVNLPVTNAAGSFGFTVLTADYLLDLELSALEQEQRGEVISSPRVVVTSQQEAVIGQGQEIPFTTTVIDQTTGAVTTQVSFRRAELQLRVTPIISPDSRVFMTLAVKQDSIAGTAPNGQIILNTRDVNTAVLVDDGQTVVLGGIYTEDRQRNLEKVPGLGDLPAVGTLFRRKTSNSEKQELLIFVTPRILADSLN